MDTNITRDNTMDVAAMMQQQRTVQQLESAPVPVQAQSEYNHGDYVPGENGEAGGILIDSREELRQQTEAPQINDIKKYIQNQQDQIARIQAGESPQSVLGISGGAQKEIENANNVGVTDRIEIEKVRKEFAKFEMSANGLAPAGSPEAQQFKQKMQDLQDGKVNLQDYANIPPQQQIQQPAPAPQLTSPDVMNNNQQPNEVAVLNTPIPVQSEPVQFNVPEGKVNQFITTMDIADRQKMVRTDTIVVNEVKTLNIPTATRTISSLSEYKRIAPRTSSGEIVECVLPSSGYVATVKGCSSLAMVSILPDNPDDTPDYNKRFQFCYDNLVNTSIGRLSYQEFITHTSAADLNILLFNIFKASEVDDQTANLNCGLPSCRTRYEINYKISELIDTEVITDEMVAQINKIIDARDVTERAKAIHDDSPIRQSKYIQVEYADKTVVVEMRLPDGAMAIDRMHLIESIAEQYSRFVALLVMSIPRLLVTFKIDGDENPSTYEITDVGVISEILVELNDSAIKGISTLVTELEVYDPMTYSFKGNFKCPNCGRVLTKVPCSLDDLLFIRVQKAMR